MKDSSRMRYLRRLGIGLGLSGALIVSGCAAPGDQVDANEASQGNMTLDVFPAGIGLFYGPLLVAQQEGFFEEEGVDVTITPGGGGSSTVAAIVGGTADIGLGSLGTSGRAVVEGQDLIIISAENDGLSLTVVVSNKLLEGSGITPESPLADKVALLEGQAIGVLDVGGSTGDFARSVLEQGGADADSVTLLNMAQNAAQLAALEAGTVGAIINTSPIVEQAEVDGIGTALISPALDMPDLAEMHYILSVTKRDFAEANRDAIEAYLRGLQRGLDLIHDDPATAEEAYFAYVEEFAGAEPMGPDVQDLVWANSSVHAPESILMTEEGFDLAQSFFEIPEEVSFDGMVDNSFAKNALEALDAN